MFEQWRFHLTAKALSGDAAANQRWEKRFRGLACKDHENKPRKLDSVVKSSD